MVHTPTPSDDASPNPLPTNEQQRNPRGPAVAPVVAGRAPPKWSTTSPLLGPYKCFCITSAVITLDCIYSVSNVRSRDGYDLYVNPTSSL